MGKKPLVAGFIEPRAFDVKEPEARDEARQGECVDAELGDGFVGARIGLVVEDMDRAVADLQEVDVPGDVARLVAGVRKRRIEWLSGYDRDAVFVLKRRDVVFAKPDWNFNGNRHAVVGQHKALQFGMPVAVGADARDDQRRRVSGGVALFHHDEPVKGEKIVRQFRGASALLPLEEFVGACAWHAFEKIGERCETGIAFAAVIKRAVAQKGELGAVISEFIHLRVIELDDADKLRRGEKLAAPCADAGRLSGRDAPKASGRSWPG